MQEESRARIRIRLNNGAELEAEGATDFVKKERELFLATQENGATCANQPNRIPQTLSETRKLPHWEDLIEHKGPIIQLRAKLRNERTEKDACLVLLAASDKLLHQPKPTAAQLARWLRASGYPIQRVDRAISQALGSGDILASGARRARRYAITGPGRVKAFLLAEELSRQINGEPVHPD